MRDLREQDGRGWVDNQRKTQEVKPLIKNASDIESAPIPWLIKNFIARRGISSVQGLPDSGKTFFTLNLVATVAMGGVFPDDNFHMERIPQGCVLYANFDDSLEYTVKPRLERMGVTAEAFDNISFVPSESGLTFQDPRLREAFEQVRPDLAVFDTLQHFIGASVDLNRANETNAALINLKNLCEEFDTAAVVVQHVNKQSSSGTGGASVCWGIGSVAINGLFRAVWTLGKVTKEGAPPYRRALAPTKTNLLPSTPPARLYDLDPEYGFMWTGVDNEITAQDLRGGDKKAAHRPADRRSEAEEFLLEALGGGAIKSSELSRLASERGISRNTLDRARQSLYVTSYRDDKEWYVSLPDSQTVNSPKTIYIGSFGGVGIGDCSIADNNIQIEQIKFDNIQSVTYGGDGCSWGSFGGDGITFGGVEAKDDTSMSDAALMLNGDF
jgi:hypothetical protein